MPEAETVGIPVVDISEFNQATADALVEAASTMGFVMIEGSGFSKTEVEKAFKLVSTLHPPHTALTLFENEPFLLTLGSQSAEFFDTPLEEKSKVPITEGNHGYSSMNLEVYVAPPFLVKTRFVYL